MSACPRCGRCFDDGRFCPADGCLLVEAAAPEAGASAGGDDLGDAEASRATAHARVGTVVDGFRIDGVLGQGATGTVYRATQVALARPVALKVLHTALARDAGMVARFHREARALARLQHPGVVAVLAVGECDDGAPYLAMERVAGATLERALDDGPMAPARAAAIGAQIAAALAESHAAGVIHRDLKPANVMLAPVPGGGGERAVLVDFGIARALDEEMRLTAGGVAVGTPHYMAPEQVLGGAVDGRTDVYALGAVLYRMVTGAVPFDGAGLPVMIAHLHRSPESPRVRAPALSPAFEALILRCLAKRPDERFASAAEVAAALAAIASAAASAAPRETARRRPSRISATRPDRPVRVTTDLFGTAVWQSTRRRRPRWGGWLVIAAIAAALSVGSTQLARRPEAVALATALGLDRGVELGEIVGSPLPRRFLVAAGGVAMRASLPEVITAGTRAAIELELWTADGAPLAAPEAVVTVVRPDGGVRGLGAPSIGPGHYRFQSSFAKPGRYLLQVFVLDGDATLAVPFEVSAPRGTVQVEEAVKTHLAGP